MLREIKIGKAFTADPRLRFDYSAQINFRNEQFELNQQSVQALSEYHHSNMEKINSVYQDIKEKIDAHFKLKLELLTGQQITKESV